MQGMPPNQSTARALIHIIHITMNRKKKSEVLTSPLRTITCIALPCCRLRKIFSTVPLLTMFNRVASS